MRKGQSGGREAVAEKANGGGDIPAENHRDLASVPELVAVPGHRHAAEGGAAEVEVGAATGAVPARALVGHDDRDGPPRAYAVVEALHLVARSAPHASLEQHRTHRADSRPERLHVYQRPVPTCSTCNFSHHKLVLLVSQSKIIEF